MKKIILIISIAFFINTSLAQTPKTPSFEDVISLRSVANAVISPDGKHVVFIKQSVDWKENRYDNEVWISKNGETIYKTKKGPIEPSDEITSTRRGKKIYIHLMNSKKESYFISDFAFKIKKAIYFGTNSKVTYSNTKSGLTLNISKENRNDIDTIIEIDVI